ncbi:MAG: gliding motility-associated C-terminal domain-containing protein, partial [Phaeodactylibacter sp.]|nr:gliding motility-associated C-terminal domain-containing protein [Phaeodactylibacter sp.]
WYSAGNTTGSDTLVSSLGCDSILNVFLSFYPAPQFISVTDDLCADEVFEYNGVFYDVNNSSGTQTIQSVQTGCDSIIADIQLNFETLDVNLNVQPPSCEGLEDGSLTISSIDGTGTPYLYSLDTTALQSLDNLPFTINNLTAGDYQLQIESANGCMITVPVFIEEGPEPLVDLGESLLIDLGEAVTLKPVINFAYDSLFWSPEELFSCDTCETVTIVPSGNTLVTLMVIDSLGCIGQDELNIFVHPERHRYAPNIFSPNFDGVNDKFLIYTDPQQVARIRTFQIYDRWGDQVFVQNNIDPYDQQAGWDGTFRGQKAPLGVYVYFAEIEYIDGIVEFLKGGVTLVR